MWELELQDVLLGQGAPNDGIEAVFRAPGAPQGFGILTHGPPSQDENHWLAGDCVCFQEGSSMSGISGGEPQLRPRGARQGHRVTCPEAMWSVLRYRKGPPGQRKEDGSEQSAGSKLGARAP